MIRVHRNKNYTVVNDNKQPQVKKDFILHTMHVNTVKKERRQVNKNSSNKKSVEYRDAIKSKETRLG